MPRIEKVEDELNLATKQTSTQVRILGAGIILVVVSLITVDVEPIGGIVGQYRPDLFKAVAFSFACLTLDLCQYLVGYIYMGRFFDKMEKEGVTEKKYKKTLLFSLPGWFFWLKVGALAVSAFYLGRPLLALIKPLEDTSGLIGC